MKRGKAWLNVTSISKEIKKEFAFIQAKLRGCEYKLRVKNNDRDNSQQQHSPTNFW